ncbi:MAG: TlpA disulfide reductase family protein [Terriglobales bacterium]
MKCYLLGPILPALTLVSISGPAQSPAGDALKLLNSVSDHYAQAQSYRIEVVKEQTYSSELRRHWQKEFLTAVVAPEGRYRYEVRTWEGPGALVSDGKTRWEYHGTDHFYTQTAISATDKTKTRYFSQVVGAIDEAKHLVREIGMMASRLKSAEELPEETIELDGRKIDCFVVKFGSADYKKTGESDVRTQETVWIAKSSNAVVRTFKKSDTYSIESASDAHIPELMEETITYPVTELGRGDLESTFTFVPPADAKLVESFPEPKFARPNDHKTDLVGKQAPDVSLKGPDGKVVSLSSFHGKPVFLDFWSTWCMPCVDLVPELKKLHEETSAKGLVWVGIDNDDDPSTAIKFLSQENVPWPNYHDGDGAVGKAFSRQGIPLAVVIDPGGTVTFYKSAYGITELKAAIENLKLPLSGLKPAQTTPGDK